MTENSREEAEKLLPPYLIAFIELCRKGCFLRPESKILVDNNYYFGYGASGNYTILELIISYAPKIDLQDFLKIKQNLQFESGQWKSTYGKLSRFTLEQQLTRLYKQRKDFEG